jgi:predicted kinase
MMAPMTPTVYALCGLPFAGKSSVAGALARRSGAPVIRLDAINHERGLGLDGSAIPWDEWERTYDEAYRRIDRALADGNSVIFDHGNFNRSERDRVREIGKRHQARVVTIYVPSRRTKRAGGGCATAKRAKGTTSATRISNWRYGCSNRRTLKPTWYV